MAGGVRRAKVLARDLTPPLVWRSLQRLRGKGHAPVDEHTHDVRADEAPPEWYDESFESADHWRDHYSASPWYYIWTVIVDRLQMTDTPYVLEIGCGPGQLAWFIRDRGFTDYVGFDFSVKRIEWARATVPELRFEIADVYTTDLLESVPYNTVICTEFLEHVKGDVEVLRRVRAGARVLGTVPNFGGGSHVRCFRDADEVAERYGQCFTQLRVDTFTMPLPRKQQFLIDGVAAGPATRPDDG